MKKTLLLLALVTLFACEKEVIEPDEQVLTTSEAKPKPETEPETEPEPEKDTVPKIGDSLHVYHVDNHSGLHWRQANELCDNLNAHGYDDWFLPDTNHLAAMYDNRDSIPRRQSSRYWSSREISVIYAYSFCFMDATGYTLQTPKETDLNVRCIRRVDK